MQEDHHSDVVVEDLPVDDQVAEVVRGVVSGHRVLVLPMRLEGMVGIYPDAVDSAPKELRSVGVEAEFAHGPSQRRFQSEYSHDVLAVIALGVASNVTWDVARGVGRYLGIWAKRLGTQNIDVSIARLDSPHGAKVRGLRIRGSSPEVAEKIVSILAGGKPDHEPRS